MRQPMTREAASSALGSDKDSFETVSKDLSEEQCQCVFYLFETFIDLGIPCLREPSGLPSLVEQSIAFGPDGLDLKTSHDRDFVRNVWRHAAFGRMAAQSDHREMTRVDKG